MVVPSFLHNSHNTMVTDTPPSYRKSIAEDEKSFVNMRACQQHASLLHTFFQLRSNNAETEKAYLVRAELRYLLWIQLVAKEKPDANILPPIDVVYMWHAHLLSPFRYYEDMIRNNMELFLSPEHAFPLELLDLAKSQYQNGVDPESEAFWHRAYPKEPYLLTPENLNSGQAIITCPYCLSTLASEWSQYVKMRTDKTKSIECDGCGKNVNVQVLSSARFMKDLAECTTDSVKVAGWHLDRGGEYHEVNKNLATRVVELASRLDAKNWRTSGRRFNWQEIFGTMKSKNVRTPTTMSVFRIMGKVAQSHYAGIPFSTSLDLIFAVSRQWDFTEKMVDINWNSPEALADAVTRYRKFLMLMKDHPSQIMVPILSIDLAWHTHMLNHAAYREYTLLHLKKVINHDDTITSTLINCNLITTAKLWYAKYREPYTTEDLGKLYKKENKAGFLFPPTTLYYMLQKKNLSKAWQEQSLAQNGEKRKPQRQDIVNHDSTHANMLFGSSLLPAYFILGASGAYLGAAACQIGAAGGYGGIGAGSLGSNMGGCGSSMASNPGGCASGRCGAGGCAVGSGGACAGGGGGCGGGGGGGGCGGGGGGCGGGGGGGCGGGC